MVLAAGLHAVYGEPPGDIPRVVELLVNPRWPWQPQLLRALIVPGGPPPPRFKGKIPLARLAEAVTQALEAPTAKSIHMSVSRLERSNHAWNDVDAGRGWLGHGPCPLDLRAFIRLEGLPAGKTAEDWLEVAHGLLLAVGASHGVIAVGPEWPMHDEVWLSTTWLNGRAIHPQHEEISRTQVNRRKLGPEKVRPPRWGTYLGPAHVAAAGGRDRIAEVVAPPVMRDLGPLLYVQLSASFADALAPETEARRRALANLLRDITI